MAREQRETTREALLKTISIDPVAVDRGLFGRLARWDVRRSDERIATILGVQAEDRNDPDDLFWVAAYHDQAVHPMHPVLAFGLALVTILDWEVANDAGALLEGYGHADPEVRASLGIETDEDAT